MFTMALRSRMIRTVVALAAAGAVLGACSKENTDLSGTNIEGAMPDLVFSMTRARDGETVSAGDYDGKVKLLYFGYTFCPDICPLTLANIAQALEKIGKDASDVRVLFVTVDPDRDTLKVLKDYANAFGPQVVGLRGTDNQLAALARRYHAAYSVDPGKAGDEYTVTHSPAVYLFGKKGKARLLYTGLASPGADVEGLASDLERLTGDGSSGQFFSWL